ncbi:MAG: hypothetical protein ACREA8_05580 [Nitrosotalea sp.]
MKTLHLSIIIGAGIAVCVVFGLTFFLQPALSQENPSHMTVIGNDQMLVKPISVITHNETKITPSRYPDPFFISVNGHTTPAIVATVKRGQTSQVDVFISPNISGVTGKVGVSRVVPMCGSMIVDTTCTPVGTTATLSANVTSPTHLVLTFNVSNDMPIGVYPFEVSASTRLNVPYQATPVNAGDVSSFSIQID